MITRIIDASLKPYNTFGIDCRCAWLVEFSDENDLKTLYDEDVFGGKWVILGEGANTLLDCRYYDGIVLRAVNPYLSCTGATHDGSHIRAGAAWVWDDFVSRMTSMNLSGAENLSGIPAALGGAVVQNIGAYGREISELIESVEVFNTRDGTFYKIDKSECGFGYRTSIFKRDSCPWIVVYANFILQDATNNWQPCLRYEPLRKAYSGGMTMHDIRSWILNTRNSKLPDPKKLGNAGSFFVNPVVSEAKAAQLRARFPGMPEYKVAGGIKLAAGWLIENAGLKGCCIGAAAVDDRNALVLVNHGGASGSDILALANHVISIVQDKFDVELHPEVRVIR